VFLCAQVGDTVGITSTGVVRVRRVARGKKQDEGHEWPMPVSFSRSAQTCSPAFATYASNFPPFIPIGLPFFLCRMHFIYLSCA
jgi:hypothetical protein